MRSVLATVLAVFLVGCSGGSQEGAETSGRSTGEGAAAQVLIQADEPDPIPVPEPRPLASDTDWENKVHNKEIEVIEVLNILNPVAAYITAGFERFGDQFSPILHEEWTDTQGQLTKALTLYDSCKERKTAGSFDKKLFLDMEEVWQLLVKTGVAGVRTKTMVDAEAKRIVGS